MQDSSASATSGRAKKWWVMVPILAYLFALFAGRGWPVRTGPDFPKIDGDRTHPAAEATLSVYSPDTRTMRLWVDFFVEESAKLPPLQISVIHDGVMESSVTATTQPDDELGLEVEAPLWLTRGNNTVRLTVGSPNAEPTAFLVKSVRMTQAIFNAGNLWFCLVLAVVAAGSILTARALGMGGADQFCAAPLIGFLLVTATGTVLSPWHLLTAGIWSAALLGSSLALGVWSARRLARRPLPVPTEAVRPWEAVVLLAVAAPAFAMHILLPITRWDDLMYHAPRAVYWMEHASALPFASHDDRLSVFPIGGDLLFACGTIISGAEMPGKFLVGLSFPLLLLALFALLKRARIRAGVGIGAVLIFAVTPRITYSVIEIKPDLWLVLMGVVALHGVLAARRGDGAASPGVFACLAAAAVGAALGIKWTAAPLLALIPFCVSWPGIRRAGWWPPVAAFAVALSLGGAGPILLSNLWNAHHPFGPAAMRYHHQIEPGLHPLVVHLKRLPFMLFGPPFLPGEAARAAFARWEGAAADAVGATETLKHETDPNHWPGVYAPDVKLMDDRYSLGWVFILAGLGVGFGRCLRGRKWEGRGGFLLAAALSLVLFAAVVTQVRWQNGARVPERFFLPAYAYGLIAAAWSANGLLSGKRWVVAVLAGALVLLHAVPYLVTSRSVFFYGDKHGWESPEDARTASDLDEAAQLIAPGHTILLLANQESQDYPLFLAREEFANRVVPLGKAAYDPAAFNRAVRGSGVDAVVIVPPDPATVSWDPPRDTAPFIRDMDSRTDFLRLPDAGRAVVYVRRN